MLAPLLAILVAWLVTPGPQAVDPAGASGSSASPSTSGATGTASQEAAEAAEPQRVVLRISRHETVHGVVELEDDSVIVIRTPRGELVSHPKTRILQIVRLVKPGHGGQPGLVIMLDGQVREGIILADEYEHVLVQIEGIKARIRRQVIDHVVLEPTFLEKYEAYKASLDDDEPARHLLLCQWLFDQRAFELGRRELAELLSRHDVPEAQRLLTIIEAQQALDAGRGEGEPQPETVDNPPAAPATLPGRVLTDEEINLVRVYEIDFRRPPRMAIRPETVIAMLEAYADDPRVPTSRTDRQRLTRADPVNIARFMFELRAREFYGGIEVLSEPHALNLFREQVHNRWLMNSCSTSRCHGGPEAQGLFLRYRNHRDPRVRYANLLTLERLDMGPDARLVDYDSPIDSLIIQYGLPADEARRPHPEVPGWSPVFRDLNDRMVRDTIEWIRAMYNPRPEYPVDFEPPTPWKDVAAEEPPLDENQPRQDR